MSTAGHRHNAMGYQNIRIPDSVLHAPRVKQQFEIEAELAAYREAFKLKCIETGIRQKEETLEKLKWVKSSKEQHYLYGRLEMAKFLITQIWVSAPPRGGVRGYMRRD